MGLGKEKNNTIQYLRQDDFKAILCWYKWMEQGTHTQTCPVRFCCCQSSNLSPYLRVWYKHMHGMHKYILLYNTYRIRLQICVYIYMSYVLNKYTNKPQNMHTLTQTQNCLYMYTYACMRTCIFRYSDIVSRCIYIYMHTSKHICKSSDIYSMMTLIINSIYIYTYF